MSSRSTLFAVRRRLSAAGGAALLAAAGTLVTAPSASAATTYCANITPVSQRPTLRVGDQGWCVQELQARLNRDGYAIAQDHEFGPRTLSAVKSFQTRKSLAATGVVDARTWTALLGGTQEIAPYTSLS